MSITKSMTSTVVLDENVLLTLPRFGDTVVRQPDFVDFEFQTAVWIGEDATVEVRLDKVTQVAMYARQHGVYALRGIDPSTLGVVVVTHREGFVHPAFSAYQDATKAQVNTLWREIADVLDADA